MSEEIDHLAEFEAVARRSMSTAHIDLVGLSEARAHQRGEAIGKAVRPPNRQSKRAFTDAQIFDMTNSRDPLSVVAKRNKTTKQTVANYRHK